MRAGVLPQDLPPPRGGRSTALRRALTGLLLGVFCALVARRCAVQAQESAPSPHVAAVVHDSPAGRPAAGGALPPELVAARACWLEATWRTDDCTAVLYVLMRRADRARVDLSTMAWRYTALRASTPRAELARQLPDGDEPSWSPAYNRRWAALRAHAAAVLAGRVLDPCPGATHWGGLALATDRRRAETAVRAGRWRRVQCARPTANAFFVEVRR